MGYLISFLIGFMAGGLTIIGASVMVMERDEKRGGRDEGNT